MWGFIVALISGALMSIQGVFNTEVTKQTSLWVSTGWVQLSAFVVCVLSWLFQLTVHEKGTCLSRSSDGKFQHKSRDSQDDQTQKIDQHKAATAILPAHPREFPHISAANGAPGGQQDEAQAGPQLFAFHDSSPFCINI